MTEPTVAQAKAITQQHEALGTIVMTFDRRRGDGSVWVGGASYGRTRGDCRQLETLLDKIIEGLDLGSLRGPS